MKKVFKVSYDIKCVDKSSMDYGVIIEKTKKFKTFIDAVNFIKKANTSVEPNTILVGVPVLEDN